MEGVKVEGKFIRWYSVRCLRTYGERHLCVHSTTGTGFRSRERSFFYSGHLWRSRTGQDSRSKGPCIFGKKYVTSYYYFEIQNQHPQHAQHHTTPSLMRERQLSRHRCGLIDALSLLKRFIPVYTRNGAVIAPAGTTSL